MFERISVMLTLMVMVANVFLMVVTLVPGFGINETGSSTQATELYGRVMPGGIDANSATNNADLAWPGIQEGDVSLASTVSGIADLLSTSIVNVVSSAKYVLQFLLFMIVGYILILQNVNAPVWVIAIVGIIVFPLQMLGLFYIATYLFNSLRGRA